ncbi:hypothetical protein F5B21DRAFT_299200 [Xylaria acuta]|nr:hypothetical protein F5B21DRAFT_299200 [Xylaria acuta]
MAAPIGKPLKTSPAGRPNKPIYARTSVLCNGQIVWKVGGAQDMEYTKTDVQRADLRSIADVKDDLNALNGLQIYRSKPLTPLEVKQPLRHVQSSLPKNVKAQIYTGDLYGSAEGVFSCPDDQFKTKAKRVFENEVRGDGDLNYNDFFRRLRRAEWLLWDVEAEKGHWVAVIAHLYKSTIRNPNKKFFPDNIAIPSSIISPDFNRINEWCVVTAQRSPQGDAMVDRVKKRLPTILKEGRIGIDNNSEIQPAIWVPMDETNWSSGLRVYALIKTLMHRVTEFHCTGRRHRPTFWHPVSGWLNVDEIRAEMQGRAAQRCMAATGYRSRIAIEGVRRWIGSKEVIRANELRPRRLDSQAYRTGKVGEDGRCIPVGPYNPDSDSSDDGPDDNGGKGPEGQSKGASEEASTDGGASQHTPSDKKGKQPSHTQNKSNVNKFGGPFKPVNPVKTPKSGTQGQATTAHIQNESNGNKFGGPFKTVHPITKGKSSVPGQTVGKKTTPHTQNKSNKTKLDGPLDPPPSKVHGWETNTTDDSDPFKHLPIDKLEKQLKWWGTGSTKQATSHTQNKSNKNNFGGPLDPPPSKVHGWYDDSTDDSGPFKHIPSTKLSKLDSSGQSLIKNATSQAQKTPSKPNNTNFAGPLDPPPSKVHGWHDDSTDDDGPFKHIPLTKQALLNSSAAALLNQPGSSKSLKEPATPGNPPSAKVTASNPTQGINQHVQAKHDPKGKGKQVDKDGKKNSKRKAQEATMTLAVEKVGDGGASSKKRLKADSSKKGLNAILSILDCP